LGKVSRVGEALIATILFIPLSAAQYNLKADWAKAGAEIILRRCPICSQDSIVGHGRRRKQAHDEHHDWIPIRRGRCRPCHKTFTFLPPFSPPYGHYSFIARSQALQRYFLEGCSCEAAAPTVKDPDRVADPSTLRRWFHSLDSSRPPFSFLRPEMRAIDAWLGKAEIVVHGSLPLRWHTVFPFLTRFWPLRI
jgi:transposase-like protein